MYFIETTELLLAVRWQKFVPGLLFYWIFIQRHLPAKKSIYFNNATKFHTLENYCWVFGKCTIQNFMFINNYKKFSIFSKIYTNQYIQQYMSLLKQKLVFSQNFSKYVLTNHVHRQNLKKKPIFRDSQPRKTSKNCNYTQKSFSIKFKKAI